MTWEVLSDVSHAYMLWSSIRLAYFHHVSNVLLQKYLYIQQILSIKVLITTLDWHSRQDIQ